MLNRRFFMAGLATSLTLAPTTVLAQTTPSADKIQQSLEAAPAIRLKPRQKIRRGELRRRRDLRIAAPSIDIQAVNFAFGSARIPRREYWKVEEIAIAMRRILRRDPNEVFLIEGHTDAVGSRYNNQILSEERAASLKRILARHFHVTPYALETVGYGEDDLLVYTPYANWRNRRVTLRRVTDFLVN